jgi:hypothetical protein
MREHSTALLAPSMTERQSTETLLHIVRLVGALYALELFGIWCAGSLAAWAGADSMLKSSSIVGGLVLTFAVWSLSGASRSASAPWRGVLLFAASWLVFPLFKAIRQGWITHTYDATLLMLDRTLWGGLSLPEHALGLERVWLSEVLCAGYFCFYLVVLLPVIFFAARRATRDAQWFLFGLNLMYMIGFAGYMLVPAGGPYMAFPATFPYPVQGGPITTFLTGLVAQGITGMDVFPSLHSGISIYVWGFLTLAGYRRAAWLLAPIVLSIVVATVYLRYHYGIDLIAGVLLAVGVLRVVHMLRKENR